jgi:hypothetical protein
MPTRLLAALLLALCALPGLAAESLKPFVMASKGPGDATATALDVRAKLEAGGFKVVGSYQPYPTATVLVVTDDLLLAGAAAAKGASYGAAQRVTITAVGEEVQVAYTSPIYMQHAYRMKTDLSPVAARFEAALGRGEAYGPKDGKTPRDLGDYHYMFSMPYFDEPVEIAKLAGHAEAVAAIEAGLAAGRGGASKVYRIDLPGTEDTLFGVALAGNGPSDDCASDARIMREIDFKPLRSTGHLPYELLVTGGTVRMLHAKFRIAVNFPDLAMAGSHSFMGIMCAPGSIEDAMKRVAGTKG